MIDIIHFKSEYLNKNNNIIIIASICVCLACTRLK